jgi:hypothetical protein
MAIEDTKPTEAKRDGTTQAEGKLPFEPVSTKKKPPKISSSKAVPVAKSTKTDRRSNNDTAERIPEVVSQRMARRMAFFSGIPTILGMATFIVSYFLVRQGVDLPPTAVLLVSALFFGIGVVGLSYGLLSASWDEENVGSLLGTEQFGVNFGRLRAGWKEARQKKG